MIGTEDNFIKTLLSKYNEGIDNIINEDSEAFNNITNNGEFENNSLFGEENEITETNTITETIEMKKEITKKGNHCFRYRCECWLLYFFFSKSWL